MDELKQKTMVNYFVHATGCTAVESENYLTSCNWQYEVSGFCRFIVASSKFILSCWFQVI